MSKSDLLFLIFKLEIVTARYVSGKINSNELEKARKNVYNAIDKLYGDKND